MSNFNHPLVSVLIPAYNHENYVQGTIRSIIDQTYQNIELIIIDDGSKDSTLAKIHELGDECHKRFAKFLVKTQENSGTCITLNRLLAEASGQYVYLIASDDLAKPTCIAKEIEFLEKHHDYSLAVGDNEFIDETGKVMYLDAEKKDTHDLAKAKFKTSSQLISLKGGLNIDLSKFGRYDIVYQTNHIPNGYLVRKATLDKIPPFTPEAPLEDWYMMLQLAKISKMKFINEILFSYRKHPTNTMRNVEKVKRMGEQTRKHEDFILDATDNAALNNWALYTKKRYGSCYREQGIPGLLEILTFKNFENQSKTKIVRLFNFDIWTLRYGCRK